MSKKKEKLYEYLFHVIFHKYWYFTQYFGMYLLLPLVNRGLSVLTKAELKLLVISILSIYIILRDFFNPKTDSFKMRNGYSVL